MEKRWRKIVQDSVRNVEGLQEYLNLSTEDAKTMTKIVERYPLCVNSYYLGLIDKEDLEDPIRKMCIPDIHEFSLGGKADTSGEAENTVMKGMQHKYKQTALILSTNQCAMYCRHCFRKRMVGATSDEIAEHLPEMEEYIRNHPEINNVLISGGDSFMNSTAIIKEYLSCFSEIKTLDFIRFGTRIPVVLPHRIIEDEELLTLLKEYGRKKQIIIVTQFNHPKELTQEAVYAIRLLSEAGCIIRNQMVLLKGVNDHPETIARLMNSLVSYGVIPYYIFQCRPVEGVKNQFQIPLLKGIDLVDAAKHYMNGQAKSVRFALSHKSGKIEVVGKIGENQMIFKYHQAKDDQNQARVFIKEMEENECWFEDDFNNALEEQLCF